jgi:hypothetical protein
MCHGADGSGTTPVGKSMKIPISIQRRIQRHRRYEVLVHESDCKLRRIIIARHFCECKVSIRLDSTHTHTRLVQFNRARFSIPRITAEKSFSLLLAASMALIWKAAAVTGMGTCILAAASRIKPKSLFMSRIAN